MIQTAEEVWQGPGRYHFTCTMYFTSMLINPLDGTFSPQHFSSVTHDFIPCETTQDIDGLVQWYTSNGVNDVSIELATPKGVVTQFEIGKYYQARRQLIKCVGRNKMQVTFMDEHGMVKVLKFHNRNGIELLPEQVKAQGYEICNSWDSNDQTLLTSSDITQAEANNFKQLNLKTPDCLNNRNDKGAWSK